MRGESAAPVSPTRRAAIRVSRSGPSIRNASPHGNNVTCGWIEGDDLVVVRVEERLFLGR